MFYKKLLMVSVMPLALLFGCEGNDIAPDDNDVKDKIVFIQKASAETTVDKDLVKKTLTESKNLPKIGDGLKDNKNIHYFDGYYSLLLENNKDKSKTITELLFKSKISPTVNNGLLGKDLNKQKDRKTLEKYIGITSKDTKKLVEDLSNDTDFNSLTIETKSDLGISKKEFDSKLTEILTLNLDEITNTITNENVKLDILSINSQKIDSIKLMIVSGKSDEDNIKFISVNSQYLGEIMGDKSVQYSLMYMTLINTLEGEYDVSNAEILTNTESNISMLYKGKNNLQYKLTVDKLADNVDVNDVKISVINTEDLDVVKKDIENINKFIGE